MRCKPYLTFLLLSGLFWTSAGQVVKDNNDTGSVIITRGKELVDEALIPVYDMTNFFLEDIVQSRDLNYMAEKGVDFSDFDSILDSFKNDYKEWANYAIGYAVCAFLGILLLVFVPLVGLFVCCFRTCCGCCGGKVDPRETSHSGCKRHCCGFFLFVFITIVFLGSLAMYFTAVRIHDELYSEEDMFHSLADGMETMGGYVNTTLDELEDGTLGVYNQTVDQIFNRLDKVVTESYDALDSTAGISRNMLPLLAFTGQIGNLNSTLSDVQYNATSLQVNVELLKVDLDNLKVSIVNELATGSCLENDTCQQLSEKVDNTTVQVNYTDIATGYINVIIGLTLADQINLNSILGQGYGNFTDIVSQVNASVIGEIDSARVEANNVASTIGQELDNVQDEIGGIDFADVAQDFRDFDEMELPAYYTFWSLVGLASVLAFIVLLTYLGLLCSCCPRAKSAKDYCCTRKIGATCLLAGVGFTFIFFFIFMLVLIPFFLTGGLMQTELCRHLVNLDQTPISGIIDDLVNASIGEEAGFTINITGIYTGCKNNEAFYTALDAESTFGFNLTELLDVSAIEDMINDIKNVDIPLGEISILNNDTVDALNELAAPLSKAAVDTETFLGELEKEVTSENLKNLAAELKELGVSNITGLADELEKLYNDSLIPIDKDRKEIEMMLVDVQDELSTNISGISGNLLIGQEKTNTEGETIIQGVVNNTADEVMDYIDTAVTDIDRNVRDNIGKCEPVYGAVASIIDAGCVEFLYAVNGYWFALGWSVFFLLVCVILSFKLATIYRKTLDHNAVIQEPRRSRNGRPPKDQRFLVREEVHELTPVSNPVFAEESYHFPRPQLKPHAYRQDETVVFVGRPPSYSQSQFVRK